MHSFRFYTMRVHNVRVFLCFNLTQHIYRILLLTLGLEFGMLNGNVCAAWLCRFSEPGAKTVIPAKVIGKFSIRLVPDQKPEVISALVTQHLETQMAKRGSPNKMKCARSYWWMLSFTSILTMLSTVQYTVLVPISTVLVPSILYSASITNRKIRVYSYS